MDVSGPYERRWEALAVLCLSLVVIGMDHTILNVALPTLVRDLGASAGDLQWIVDSYTLVFAGLLLTMGSLGDRFGRKRALLVGLVVFAAGSVASASAGSPGVLIAARALMGAGAALIMPSTLSIITNMFSGRERGRAIALWAAVAGAGIVAGPVLGGWLLERFWWGSVFLLNIPVIAVALVAGTALVPESKDRDATPLDPIGALLSITGLTSLVYAIIEASERGWTDGAVLVPLGAAALLLATFVRWERTTPQPMLPVAFFRDPRFSAGSASITLVFFALFGTVFVLTQHLQFVLGYTPLEAGIRLTPIAFLVPAAALSARLTERFGTKAVVSAGLAVVAAGLAVLASVDAANGYGLVAAALVILGVGMGLTMAPATDAVMSALPLNKAGVGSAMNDTTRMVGGALGVAVIGTVLSSAYASRVAPVAEGLPGPAAAVARDSVGGAVGVAHQLGEGGNELLIAARTAFVEAMGTSVTLAAAAAAVGALLALLFLPSHAPAKEGGRDGTAGVPSGAAGRRGGQM